MHSTSTSRGTPGCLLPTPRTLATRARLALPPTLCPSTNSKGGFIPTLTDPLLLTLLSLPLALLTVTRTLTVMDMPIMAPCSSRT